MLPNLRRTFITSWAVGVLIVLCSQIVALAMPPVTPGSQRVVLVGPTVVVLPAIGTSLLILYLILKIGGRAESTGRTTLGGFIRVATTGFVGSFFTIFALTISVNLLIAHF
jgi:hypothetical protein